MSSKLRSLSRLAVAVPFASWLLGSAVHAAPAAAVEAPALSGGPQEPPQTVRPPVARDYASELACGATAAATAPTSAIRIAAGREHGKALFAPGDPIVVLGGTAQGVRTGQEYFVRRAIRDQFTQARSDGVQTLSIHTAGWIKIVETSTDAAIATITRACDALEEGDYLEPFMLPPVPSAKAAGEPDYAHPGHVILGDDRRQMGAPGDMMVLDRGSDHGLRVGQRLTIFRPTAGGTGPVARIGEAIALVVSPETAVIRIEKTTDPIYVGDLVAIHR
jgi:hypothetical protein